MYIASQSYLFDRTGHSLVEAITISSSRGIRFFDFSSNRHSDPSTLPPGKRKDVAAALADHGVTASQLLIIMADGIASTSATARDKNMAYMQRCGEFIREMGGRQALICVGGYREIGVAPERSWVHMLNSIGEYGTWAATMDLLVGVEMEPHVYYLLSNMDRLYRALQQIGLPNLYPNVDIGHMWMTREGPEYLDRFAGRLYHGHLSDHNGMAHSNNILGTNGVPFSAYLQKCRDMGIAESCRQAGIEPVFSMEISQDDSPVDSVENWLDRSLAYLKAHVPELSL
ncbi:MAG: sugar phosphate isomerase/epimerase [Planctomycetaceae bacterium]|nr:sugar phosphate isomerase/epimerase [Planctomycetaceae bacterium]